jgi:hypothetical protein
VRVIEGPVHAIEQTIATPRTRVAGAHNLRAFVEEAKASGFISEALADGAARWCRRLLPTWWAPAA